MWSYERIIQFSCGAAILACLGVAPAFAQDSQQSQQPTQTPQRYWDCVSPICTYAKPQQDGKTQVPYGGGTPLDVIMNTRFWTDVPPAPDFVKRSRPAEGTLQYQTTGGKDIDRPKPKTSAELQDMEDELERAGAAADRAAGVKSNFHIDAKKRVSATAKPHAESHARKPLDLSARTSQQ
jgi:hypothetical protein